MTKLLFVGSPSDEPYLPYLKGCMSGAVTTPLCKADVSLVQLELIAKAKGFTGIITSNVNILKRLLNWTDNRKDPSLDNYQGSLFLHNGTEYLILNPLFHLTAIPYAKFVYTRFISKLARPDSWLPASDFKWSVVTAGNVDGIFERFTKAFAIAVDIETFPAPLSIRCIGYTAIFLDGATWTTESCVLPVDSMWALAWMRKFNWELPAPKIFQNGKYDNAYLSMFSSVIYNWQWDTATMFHCWYSELPKDLAFLNSFCVRKSMYWKDLADTNDLHEYYRYNALDTHATAHVFIAMMIEMPEYARQNYLKEFPLVFPCHLCEMTGIKRDMGEMHKAREDADREIAELQASIETMVGVPGFNVNSAPQMKLLMKSFGLGDVESCDDTHLNKFALRHPINNRIIKKIQLLREKRKYVSTYIRTDRDIKKPTDGGYKEYRGRILYALNPHGTDSGRLASKESHFWCGLQIQNITRGPAVKRTLVADASFKLAECDLEQAESRDTAYAAGELSLIAAVEGTRDFHSVNASAFFGVSYESIYDDVKRKTLDKILRDLAKRVNHGANYCMGAAVLVATMGEDKVWVAKKKLGLPSHYGLIQVAEYLLAQFHKTYPGLTKVFYPKIWGEVRAKRMLVGATGWTRFCFKDPDKDKRAANSYVAHVAQSLNAMTLNKAFMRVFYEIALHPQYRMHFKLIAQIHDSILFQFREGHEYLINMVRERMEIPITIQGADGITRTFVVPAAAKAGPDGKGAHRWSETE
jgi:DNA polymerase I-like protein with 3'-5' exonuclease and polymerase domains